jgi:hypothetical protein
MKCHKQSPSRPTIPCRKALLLLSKSEQLITSRSKSLKHGDSMWPRQHRLEQVCHLRERPSKRLPCLLETCFPAQDPQIVCCRVQLPILWSISLFADLPFLNQTGMFTHFGAMPLHLMKKCFNQLSLSRGSQGGQFMLDCT